MSSEIRVLVADDHWVVRDGLRTFLAGEPGMTVVGEATGGRDAVDKARELRPDVVVMDLAMPDMSGVDATMAIRSELPDTEVVALTSVLDDHAVVEAIKAGASGYVLKDSRSRELVNAIRAAAEGRVYLDPDAAARLARAVASPVRQEPLSPREQEVLRLVVDGLANKQIARNLQISEKTVKGHLTSIFQKLGVQSRTQAALFAIREGLSPT